MKKGNIIAAVLTMALSIYIIITCLGYPRAEAYGTGVPGPGLWPGVIAGLMFVAALALLIESLRMKPEDDTPLGMLTDGTKRVYVTMAILVVYVAVLGFVGFIPSTIIMLFIFINWFAKKKPAITLLISVVSTLAVYCIFKFVLNVPVDFGLINF